MLQSLLQFNRKLALFVKVSENVEIRPILRCQRSVLDCCLLAC